MIHALHQGNNLGANTHSPVIHITVIAQHLHDQDISGRTLPGNHFFNSHGVLQSAGTDDFDPV